MILRSTCTSGKRAMGLNLRRPERNCSRCVEGSKAPAPQDPVVNDGQPQPKSKKGHTERSRIEEIRRCSACGPWPLQVLRRSETRCKPSLERTSCNAVSAGCTCSTNCLPCHNQTRGLKSTRRSAARPTIVPPLWGRGTATAALGSPCSRR